jgi:hypothetical protein
VGFTMAPVSYRVLLERDAGFRDGRGYPLRIFRSERRRSRRSAMSGGFRGMSFGRFSDPRRPSFITSMANSHWLRTTSLRPAARNLLDLIERLRFVSVSAYREI